MSNKTAITVNVAKADKAMAYWHWFLKSKEMETYSIDGAADAAIIQSQQRSSEIKTNLAAHKSCCDRRKYMQVVAHAFSALLFMNSDGLFSIRWKKKLCE